MKRVILRGGGIAKLAYTSSDYNQRDRLKTLRYLLNCLLNWLQLSTQQKLFFVSIPVTDLVPNSLIFILSF